MRVVLIAIYVLCVFCLVSIKKIVFFIAVSVVKLFFIASLFFRKTAGYFHCENFCSEKHSHYNRGIHKSEAVRLYGLL